MVSETYRQHPVFVATGAAGVDAQPHPEPPLDFTSASRAQQASVPADTGPPQHMPGVRSLSAVDGFVPNAS
jgi:hypothetical protein